MTQDLLARGLSPASHFSLNLHEPVKKLLDRYAAKKVFIEGDAIILPFSKRSRRSPMRGRWPKRASFRARFWPFAILTTSAHRPAISPRWNLAWALLFRAPLLPTGPMETRVS